MNELITYKTDGGEISLSGDIVRQQILTGSAKEKATDQEIGFFMARCKYLGLNPLIGEIYFAKYGDNPATYMISIEVLLGRLNKFPKYIGKQAGVTVMNTKTGEVTRREGTLVLPGETLIAGWAKIYTKGHEHPDFAEAPMSEYNQKQAQWNTRPATMIRKVALSHAIREAFPKEYEGVYIEEEMGRQDANGSVVQEPVATADTRRITDDMVRRLVAEVGSDSDKKLSANAIISSAGFSSPLAITMNKYDEIMDKIRSIGLRTPVQEPVAEVEPEPEEPKEDRSGAKYATHVPFRGKHPLAGLALKDISREDLMDHLRKPLDVESKYYEANLKLNKVILDHLGINTEPPPPPPESAFPDDQPLPWEDDLR